jgi:hypothetical protein
VRFSSLVSLAAKHPVLILPVPDLRIIDNTGKKMRQKNLEKRRD